MRSRTLVALAFAFCLLAPVFSAGGFQNEPVGFAGVRWKADLPQGFKATLVTSVSEGKKKMDIYRVAENDPAVALGDMTVLMVFVDGKFLGVHATAPGRAAMDNLSAGFRGKFGPPPPDPSGEVQDDEVGKMWFGDNSIVSVQYDPGSDTTSVALLSREMVEQNPEFLVSEDPASSDEDPGTATEVPICLDPKQFSPSCSP